jgi:hypothetical protein
MSLYALVTCLVAGRIIVWVISVAKPTQWLWRLFDECDLCLGVWVYSGLTFAMWSALFPFWEPFVHLPIITDIGVGMVLSFVVHVFRIGFEEKFFGYHS